MPVFRRARLSSAIFTVALLVLAGAACSDDPADPDTTDITDFVGTWIWTVANITSSCGPEDLWTATVVITRVGSSDTEVNVSSAWHSDAGVPFDTDGTVSGNTLTISDVTYIEEGGTLDADHVVTLQNNGNLEGTESWTWTGTGGTCTGGTADVLAVLD